MPKEEQPGKKPATGGQQPTWKKDNPLWAKNPKAVDLSMQKFLPALAALMHKAKSDEPVHEDVQAAGERLKMLARPANTAGQEAATAGFDISKPMPKAQATNADHPEGPGVPLVDGFTDAEWKSMNRTPPSQRTSDTEEAESHSIEEALLKIMKGDKKIGDRIEDTPIGRAMADTRPGQGVGDAYRRTGGESRPQDNELLIVSNNPHPQGKYQGRPITPLAHHKVTMPLEDLENSMEKGHEDSRQGRFLTTPERGTPESEITQGQLPMSEAEKRNLGDPDKPFKEGWKTGRRVPYKFKGFDREDLPSVPERSNRRADSIEEALLKLMKAPSTPGTKPTEPGGISAATPNEASNPGGVAKLPTVPLQPQIQRKTEQAQRPIQASIDKADYPSGLSNEEWDDVMEEKVKQERFGEEHQPKTDKGVYAESHIQNSLQKLMKHYPGDPGYDTGHEQHQKERWDYIRGTDPPEDYNPDEGPAGFGSEIDAQQQAFHAAPKGTVYSSRGGQYGEADYDGPIFKKSVMKSLLKIMKANDDTEREHDAVEQVRGISDFRQHVPTEERTGGFTMTDAERAASARYRAGELTGPEDDTGKATASREEALWGSTAPTPRHELPSYAEEPTGGMARESTSPTAGERADTLREHGTPTATRAAQMMAQRDKNPQRVQVHEPARGAIVASLLKLMKAPNDLAGQNRGARATRHEQGKAKTAGATQTGSTAGRDLLGRGDLAAPQGGGGDAEAHALAGSAASLLGARSAQEFYGKLGIKSPQEFADTGGVGNQPDPNTPGNVGASTNPTTPPQGSIGDGSGTGMPQTPKPDTTTTSPSVPRNTGPTVVPQGRKLPPHSNPVDSAVNRLPKP